MCLINRSIETRPNASMMYAFYDHMQSFRFNLYVEITLTLKYICHDNQKKQDSGL